MDEILKLYNQIEPDEPEMDEDAVIEPDNKSRAMKTRDRYIYRRFTSERTLENILDWDFEKGTAYHVISAGDIDSLSFLKFVLRQQPLRYCALSTWCMTLKDVEEIERFIERKRIERLDSYVGEIFKGSYALEYEKLTELHKRYGGRLAIFRNHAKIYVGFGSKFDFVIESSANINTNPRAENTVITVDTELAMFYKQYYDGIKSFERNFDDWTPFII